MGEHKVDMNDRSFHLRIMVLSTLALLCSAVWLLPHLGYAKMQTNEFTVTFLDVGQGDAVLIETPDGVEVLIDGGAGSVVLAELAAVLGPFDRTIDMVVATHPDADHVGGLIDVLERYTVGTILRTTNDADTTAADAFDTGVAEEGAEIVTAVQGQVFALGASTTLSVLFPAGDVTNMESNTSSIVLRLTYGESDVLLTGDAPARIEEYLVTAYGDVLQSEVLKLGHHGSHTASSEVFLRTVDPDHAVISAGSDNTYGHPHQEVLDRVTLQGIQVAVTMEGRVTYTSDGTTIERK